MKMKMQKKEKEKGEGEVGKEGEKGEGRKQKKKNHFFETLLLSLVSEYVSLSSQTPSFCWGAEMGLCQ